MKNTGLIIGALLVGLMMFWPKRSEASIPSPITPPPLVKGGQTPGGYTWSDLDTAFRQASYEYGVPDGVIKAMADVESAFRSDIISGQTKGAAGEIGIMQITPRWHPNVDPYDPIESIWYAAGWLRDLYEQFGDWRLAIAAYNWGPTNLTNYGYNAAPTITQQYIARVAGVTGI